MTLNQVINSKKLKPKKKQLLRASTEIVKQIRSKTPEEAVQYLEKILKGFYREIKGSERAYWEGVARRVFGSLKEFGNESTLGVSMILEIFRGTKELDALKKVKFKQ